MAEKQANGTPIPGVKKDDAEDVSWALSTAEAMWSRGDHADAVKWIRRAAEAASEAEADDRALELAKAAADLAARVGPIPTTAPPPPVARSVPPPAPVVSRPPPAPAPAPAPAATPKPVAKPAAAAAPIVPRAPAASAPKAPAPAARMITPARTTGRRKSHANLTEEARRAAKAVAIAQADETTQTVTVETPAIVPEPPRKRARSKPSADENTPAAPPGVVAKPPAPVPLAPPKAPTTDDMDQWPTQSLVGDDLDSDEKTWIGSPAYQEAAKQSVPPPAAIAPVETTQAVRVVVWQAADGIRIAPHGAPVKGISVDALLVALDPATDLASWLAARRS